MKTTSVVVPQIKAVLIVHSSKRDTNGNIYSFFIFRDVMSGASIAGRLGDGSGLGLLTLANIKRDFMLTTDEIVYIEVEHGKKEWKELAMDVPFCKHVATDFIVEELEKVNTPVSNENR